MLPASASPAFDLVVIAASLGGPEGVREIVSGLPAYFPASVVVVQHRARTAEDTPLALLRRRTSLAVKAARPGEALESRTVYLAPAARQLLIAPGLVFETRAPGGLGCEADPLFSSAAEQLGPRVLGVVLSGMNPDGARGAAAIKCYGGRVLAQDQATARCFAMPAAAIATGCVDFVLPIQRIAQAIVALTLVPGAADFFRVPLASWARFAS